MIVCCDIDGTIADCREYVKEYLPGNWDEYFKHTLEFEPIRQNVKLVKALILGGHTIHFVTGRPEKNRELTTNWLSLQFGDVLDRCALWMRPTGSPRKAPELKLAFYKMLRPDLILEDEPAAVELATKNGFKVLQIHGYRVDSRDTRDQIPTL